MKKIILFFAFIFNLYALAQDLKSTVKQQIDSYEKYSYSCTFTVPDPINASESVNALVPLQQKPDICNEDYIQNEAQLSLDNRFSTGDSVLFSATICRLGLIHFCDNVRNSLHADSKVTKEDGRPYRSPILKPTNTYSGDDNDTFSMDHTLGILLYLETVFNNIQNQPKSAQNTTDLENLHAYALKFAQYIDQNKTDKDFFVCPAKTFEDKDYCRIRKFGQIQLMKDVYTYIGITDANFPNKVDKKFLKFDIGTFFNFLAAKCSWSPGYPCHLASVAYLIEKDIHFSSKRNPNLQKNMEIFRQLLAKLSSNNPFQTYAISLPNVSPINWQKLAQDTTDVCQKALDNLDWTSGKIKRGNWLWEQENSDMKDSDKIKNIWGWDCLGMLNLVKDHL